MNVIFFKPFGNQIVKLMTIYVSKPTSLTPIWVEHFSDLSIQSLGLLGSRKCADKLLFRRHRWHKANRVLACFGGAFPVFFSIFLFS